MAKKKTSSVEQYLIELLEADKTVADGEKKLSPNKKLEAISMLQAEQARLRGDQPVEKRAPQVRVPSARALAFQDRSRDPKEEGNLAAAVKFFEGGADEPQTEEQSSR